MSDLPNCPHCGSDSLETVKIDFKDPDRDLIKCRHCRGQVSRFYWSERVISDDELNAALKERGLVAVPVDPTEAQLSAGGLALAYAGSPCDDQGIVSSYQQMIKAAQEQSSDG
jgi:hypothetical protein